MISIKMKSIMTEMPSCCRDCDHEVCAGNIPEDGKSHRECLFTEENVESEDYGYTRGEECPLVEEV